MKLQAIQMIKPVGRTALPKIGQTTDHLRAKAQMADASSEDPEEQSPPLALGVRFDSQQAERSTYGRHHWNLLILGGKEFDEAYLKAVELAGATFRRIALVGIEDHSPVETFAHSYSGGATRALQVLAADRFLWELGDHTVLLNLSSNPELVVEILQRHTSLNCALASADLLPSLLCRPLAPFSGQLHPVQATLFTPGALAATDFCLRRKGWSRRIHRVIAECAGPAITSPLASRDKNDPLSREQEAILTFLLRILKTAEQPFTVYLDDLGSSLEESPVPAPGNADPNPGSRNIMTLRLTWNDGRRAFCSLRHQSDITAPHRRVRFFDDLGQLLGDVDLTPDGCLPHVRIMHALRNPQPELGLTFEETCRMQGLIETCRIMGMLSQEKLVKCDKSSSLTEGMRHPREPRVFQN